MNSNSFKISKKVKDYSWTAALIFFLFSIAGFYFGHFRSTEAEIFFSRMAEEFSFLTQVGPFFIFSFIFINNTVKIFIGMILGIFLGIFTFLFLAINGFVIGLVAQQAYPVMGLLGLFLALAPHGIFELPALFIGSGFGFRLGEVGYNETKRGVLSLKKLRRMEFNSKIKDEFKLALTGFFKIVLPLLLIAALIETVLIFLL